MIQGAGCERGGKNPASNHDILGFFILNLLIFKISYKVIEIRYYQLQSLPPMLTNFIIRLAGGGGGGGGRGH